jgi:hypothetical protein
MARLHYGMIFFGCFTAGACGASHTATVGSKMPNNGGTTALPASDGAGPGPAPDAGPSTTDLSTLGDGADAGAKLASPSAGLSAPSQSPLKGLHTHEPGRGPEDIRALIAAHRDDARTCYDNALSEHPGIEGDLAIQWTIDPKGKVTQLSLDLTRSQIAEPSLVACIGGVIRKIEFAPSPGGFETRASYPFNFHPHITRSGRPAQ